MTKIIGILNLTLDSFSDGGMYYDLESAKKHISEMITQGADIIDIGAESTRSGFQMLVQIIKSIHLHLLLNLLIKIMISK